MSAADVLAQHIDSDTQRHRCVLLDPRHLRCLDCARTLVLPAATSTAGATSTSPSPPPLHASDRCDQHPGQRQGACGPCRAEQLAATSPRPVPAPTSDIAAGIAACRQALRTRREETTC